MSEYTNIDKYLAGKKILGSWCNKPIIYRWLEKKSMSSSLKIIDKKVGTLLSLNGGISKLKEWFFSGDVNLVTITAERYILDYLLSLNPTLQSIFVQDNVDAELILGGEHYGIEVTCFLNTIAEWIITERVQEYFDVNGIVPTHGYVFKATEKALEKFAYLSQTERCQIIEDILVSVLAKGNYSNNGFEVAEDSEMFPGTISWEFEQDQSYIVDTFVKKLESKLNDKASQLKKFSKNILFISVNSTSSNWLNPSILRELRSPLRHQDHVDALITRTKQLIADTSIVGVCYYTYDLEREKPFYPLKMITNDDKLLLRI